MLHMHATHACVRTHRAREAYRPVGPAQGALLGGGDGGGRGGGAERCASTAGGSEAGVHVCRTVRSNRVEATPLEPCREIVERRGEQRWVRWCAADADGVGVGLRGAAELIGDVVGAFECLVVPPQLRERRRRIEHRVSKHVVLVKAVDAVGAPCGDTSLEAAQSHGRVACS